VNSVRPQTVLNLYVIRIYLCIMHVLSKLHGVISNCDRVVIIDFLAPYILGIVITL